tara:strand:- start:433 stop:591 length:159 start_codon:yes stop_codon:yes gene_type:complete
MTNEKNWMLITYYCPTHGNSGRVEPLQISRDEIPNQSIDKSHYKLKSKEQTN